MTALPRADEQEQAVYRRGRNGGAHPPKNADPGHYAKATGLEALFWLPVPEWGSRSGHGSF